MRILRWVLLLCCALSTLSVSIASAAPAEDKEIAKHIARLEHYSERGKAKKALKQWGTKVIPHLINAIPKSSFSLRSEVVEMLKGFGTAAHPALLKALQHKHDRVRDVGLELLQKYPKKVLQGLGTKAGSVLLRMCWEGSWTAQKIAVKMLQRGGITMLPSIRKGLLASKVKERKCALKWVFQLKPKQLAMLTQKDMALLQASTTHKKNEIALLAIRALGKIGPKAAAAVPAMTRLFKVDSSYYRMKTREAIASIGAAAVPGLSKAISHKDKRIRSQSVRTLAALGAKAEAAMPALQRALNDPYDDVRHYAAKTLGILGAKAKGAATALCALSIKESLRPKNYFGAMVVSRALGRISRFSPEAQQCLLKAMTHTSLAVRVNAVGAIGELKGEVPVALIAALVWAFRDKAWDVAFLATDTFAKIGPKAIPSLLGVLAGSHRTSRALAALSLQKMKKQAVPALKKSLQHKLPHVRKLAARILAYHNVK